MGSSLYSASEKVGKIKAYGGGTLPPNYLLCNGAIISRSVYKALFNAIGIWYGAGDGSTTFQLPDNRGACCAGEGTGVYPSASNRQRGVFVGEEKHSLVYGENAVHTHPTGTLSAWHTHTFYHVHSHYHEHTYLWAPAAISGDNDLDDPRRQPSAYAWDTLSNDPDVYSGGEWWGTDSSYLHTHVVSSVGSGTAHNTYQPSLVVNKIIRY